ncbi:MAG: hypothetical protein JSW10_05125 [Pseudomonadota bacterium]|nr:MAG: hypothetical protein JSW10_05125 [Pseudomonadota bacterium]
MRHSYPEPQDIGIVIPRHLIAERFRNGFHHALAGGHLQRVEHLRRSFREGYRAGKLYVRELQRANGVVSFPHLGRVRLKAMAH